MQQSLSVVRSCLSLPIPTPGSSGGRLKTEVIRREKKMKVNTLTTDATCEDTSNQVVRPLRLLRMRSESPSIFPIPSELLKQGFIHVWWGFRQKQSKML